MNLKSLSALGAGLLLAACSQAPRTDSLTQYVDMRIGTGGHGHVFMGANVPFGAVQLGPTSIPQSWDWTSGYHISDTTVIGFSHTHLNGTGIGDGTVSGPLCVCRTPEEVPHKFRTGDVLVVPYTNNDLLPYMKEAAAVISEEISPEGHTATVGLLLHKPVIIGAVHATRRLSDGVQVSVDCARGIVQVMPQ